MFALLVCSLIVIAGLFILVSSSLKRLQRQNDLLLLVIACSIFPIIALTAVGSGALNAPMIHDITTDIDRPPVFRFIQADDSYRVNSLNYAGSVVSDQQVEAYPDIKTFVTTMPPRAVYQQALLVAKLSGWKIIAKDLLIFHFEAESHTVLFGFIDDIAVRITPLTDGGSAVDVRSMSRVGLSDLGANAKRIRGFLDKLEQQLISLQ